MVSFAFCSLRRADDMVWADENLEVLRTGCFKYFELGGECVRGPVSLLSGYVTLPSCFLCSGLRLVSRSIAPSPALLFHHFFSVAFYSLWVMFTHARPVPSASGKSVLRAPGVGEYPLLAVKAVRVVSPLLFSLPYLWYEHALTLSFHSQFWTACVVFAPLLWVELKW